MLPITQPPSHPPPTFRKPAPPHPSPTRRHRVTVATTPVPNEPLLQPNTVAPSKPPLSPPRPEPKLPSELELPSDLREKSVYISRLRQSLKTQCVKTSDPFWAAMQKEARHAAESEPLLASFLFATILNHSSLYSALAFHLANKLASAAMPSTMLMTLFQTLMDEHPTYCHVLRRDLLAVMERDPACTRFIDALLYFKGFHALQAHRLAHLLWNQGRFPLAYHLQSQISKELQVDIHPAASIGAGIFIDHATGIVVGETAAIGDDCSLMHHVTLGGSGKKHGDRHPRLGNGVLVGAGATLLGNVRVGDGVQIGACSLVLDDIPAHATAVGVPARVLSTQPQAAPALDMKHERCLPTCPDPCNVHPTGSSSSEAKSASSDGKPEQSKK